MIVYHGSKNKFEKFDYEYMGWNATSEGFGFYFTDSKQIAEGYASGFLYTVEFTGKKSLSSDKKTITKAQLRKFLTRLDETGQYLSNYGDTEYEGFNKVLSEAVNSTYNSDDDVEMICGICNAYGNKEEVLQELYKMFGFDSIVLQAAWGTVPHKIYIATVHEAYNIISVDPR